VIRRSLTTLLRSVEILSYNRGVAYEKQGDQAKADADFAKARQLGYKP